MGSVPAGMEYDALARPYLGAPVRSGNVVFSKVVLVVGEVASAELDRTVGIVENLDPAVPLAESIYGTVLVSRHDLGYPQVGEVLGP